jgi:cytochrome c-type biogenesis protein CcmE
VLVGVAVLLIVGSSFSSGKYSLELADVVATPERYVGREVKIVGRIKEGSASSQTEGGQVVLRFVVVDDNGHEIPISYPHNPPDPFKEGRECIVEGVYQKDGTLDCKKLTVKCPSKYQTEDGLGGGGEGGPAPAYPAAAPR